MKKKLLIDDQKDMIISLYESGLTQKKIAKDLGYSQSFISKFLIENKIATRQKKYYVNENYFEKIDTNEKSYWLGFLFADGNVRIRRYNAGELKLKLQFKDKLHIEKFKKSIGSNSPVKDVFERYKYKDQIKYSKSSFISICSKKIVDDLIKLGCFENKSKIIKFPNMIPSEFIKDFICGYFDGDGCIHLDKKNNIKFYISCGSYIFLSDLMEILYDHGVSYIKITEKKNQNFRLEVYRISDLQIIYKYFYKNSETYLERKKIIFDNINIK